MRKTALIIGANGQDASYLAELLLSKDYIVHGTVRRNSVPESQTTRIESIFSEGLITLHYMDLTDPLSVERIINDIQPDEVYHLAAQSHVQISFELPKYTLDVNAGGTLAVLEAVRKFSPHSKVYHAATSEMFGNSFDDDKRQRETTPLTPVSPYGCSKLYAHSLCNNYRNAYNMFICSGILFNHESPRRGINFVTNKVVLEAVRIKLGLSNELVLGNLNAMRDWGHAKELINISAEAGCDAVKFQKRTIDEVYTKEELDKPRESPWGTTTREQKEGIEFSIEEYKVLEAYTKEKGLDFIMSCWDLTSLKLVEEHLDVKYHKVASALLTDRDFLVALKETGKGVILSTGMTSQDEIDLAVEILGDSLVQIMACTSTYPTKPEEINLNYVKTLKEKFPNLVVGFSNHYSGALACHGAVVAGAEVIEFHITKDRTMYGSDQAASIENVDALVHGVRTLELMLGDGVKVIYEAEKPIADKLRKVKSLA